MNIEITPEIKEAKQRFGIIGNSPALMAAVGRALQVAPIDLSVLINGESGAGKEFFPQIIHAYSSRKHSKYIAVNCGAIPEGTIDSELFGHEKGAFTGAISSRKGYFEEANGGTIFLDEVAELPLTTQARLLRVLESGEFIKVGSSEVQKTNIRVVAATNVNMQKAVSEGRFREDLYYRLNTIPVKMPALRERGEDILLLFRLFTMQMAEKYNIPRITLTDDAKRLLLKYKWPGNVRQLKNITEQISVLSEKREIDANGLRHFIPEDPESTQLAMIPNQGNHSYENERELLYKILYELRGNVSEMRREMNDMRKQMNEQKTETPVDTYAQPYHALAPANYSGTATPMRGNRIEEVEAEEIKDTDSLNLNDLGRQLVERALDRNGGNRKKAAKELGISDRTLYRRIKQYGLDK